MTRSHVADATENYLRLIEGLPDAVFLLNPDQSTTLMNPAGERLLKRCEEDAGLVDICELLNAENTDTSDITQVFDRGQPLEREGTLFGITGVWQQRLIPVFGKNGTVDYVSLILRDITKEKQVSESLKRADKLATLGTLAAGVAHEINNPNHVITINIPIIRDIWNDVEPLIRRAIDAGELSTLADIPADEFLEEIPLLYTGIAESAERIKSIVLRLKDYVRERPMAYTQVRINKVIDDAITMTRSRLKKMTGVFVFEAGEKLPLILGDSQQIEQVLVNMLLNACDAIADIGGAIIVKSKYIKADGCIVVTVTDGGMGMSAAALARIGDPFYTTKLERGGTGLGVSISMRIIEDHGGELKYISAPGRGTTARISLPATTAEAHEHA